MSASIGQIWNIVASRSEFVFTPTFTFCSPICSSNCGVFFEKWLFSFDRSNMQIFIVNITRLVWPHVTIPLDLLHFCQHNTLFYHLKINPLSLLKLAKKLFFLMNIFVRHTFPMSKSSIKSKTVLTMTDMTQSTELQAFKRPKDGYKVTVKISLCICVVLSWDELKVRQNSDHEIYMVILSTCQTFAKCADDPQVLELLQICFVRIKTAKQITVISHKSRAKKL